MAGDKKLRPVLSGYCLAESFAIAFVGWGCWMTFGVDGILATGLLASMAMLFLALHISDLEQREYWGYDDPEEVHIEGNGVSIRGNWPITIREVTR